MIPRTYPSRVNSTTGRVEALVSFISSTTGLQRWVDYTPVAFVTDATPVEGSYNNNGYIAVADVGSTTGLQAGKDYIRVYLDPNATDAWRVNSVGFIPVGYSGIGGIPYALFANNEQGVWYDPSDRTTLFQDSAGTTPVTAVEQPVGLMLDKSKGLVLGSELVTNGTFDTNINGWTFDGTAGGQSWASGKLRVVSGSNFARSYTTITTVIGKMYKVRCNSTNISGVNTGAYISKADNAAGGTNSVFSVVGAAGDRELVFTATATTTYILVGSSTSSSTNDFDNISVRELPGNHAFQATATSRPVLSARYNLLLNTETLATQNVTTAATTQRLRFEGTGSITLSGTATGTYSAGSHTFSTTAGTLTLTVTGSVTKADLRASNDAFGQPAYQRVTTATNYDTVDFKPYLRFDGTDDWLQTNSINFTATDKMTVFAGVRKLSDAAYGMITELSTSFATLANYGSFYFGAGNQSGSPNAPAYSTGSRGSIAAAAAQSADAVTYVAPITNVVTATHDISGDSTTIRADGATAASGTGDKGTGNFGNYPLYIGRRGGTTLPFNGLLYGLIVRGAATTTATIQATETYMNGKTGAY